MEESAKVRVPVERLACIAADILDGKGSLNARINIFYMLDTLCDPITSANSLPPPSASQSASGPQVAELPYAGFLEKDLATLVGFVVPEGKEGMLNLLSAKQVSAIVCRGWFGDCLFPRCRSPG